MATKCAPEIVHKIGTTISDGDCRGPVTAIAAPVKAHLPTDYAILYLRICAIHPTSSVSSASSYSGARCRHPCPGSIFKTHPPWSYFVVTNDCFVNDIIHIPVTID